MTWWERIRRFALRGARSIRRRSLSRRDRLVTGAAQRKDLLLDSLFATWPERSPTTYRVMFAMLRARFRLEATPGWQLRGAREPIGELERLRLRFWESLRTPTPIPWMMGLKVYVHPSDEISHAVYFEGSYEPNEMTAFLSLLEPGMSVIDLGANMGLFTLAAARRVGKTGTVVAVEPSLRESQKLMRNVTSNRLGNVRVRRNAVSDEGGPRELLVAEDSHPGHNTLGAFAYDTVTELRREQVAGITLDDLVEAEGLERVDVLKVDIEGAEYAALTGGLATLERWRPSLLVEVTRGSATEQEAGRDRICRLLWSYGYVIFDFDPESGAPSAVGPGRPIRSESVLAVRKSPDPLPTDGQPWAEHPHG